MSQSSRNKMVTIEGIVAGEGNHLTQLHSPHRVIVDQLDCVYLADNNNHRIMRWSKGSTEGSVVVVEGNEEDSPEFP